MDGFLGQVIVFAGTFAPRNWALCNGQVISISSYQALFSLLGTNYGGDGRNTLGVPDLRGRTPVGTGAGPGLSHIGLGQLGGAEGFILKSPSQLPAHSHPSTFLGASASGKVSPSAFGGRGNLTNDPTGRFPAKTATGTDIYADSSNTQMGQSDVNVTVSDAQMLIGDTGMSEPVEHRSPYLGMNWIICTNGLYPSRN